MARPMMEMNMTPLIDVLLVLLIVFIMSIPIATHAVSIDLPVPDPNPPPEHGRSGQEQDRAHAGQRDPVERHADHAEHAVANLQTSLTYAVEPELQFEPEAQAAYDLSAKVLKHHQAVGVTKFGFVGNEKYRVFSKA
jgi:biopolymer transport protein ExbD